MDVYDIHVPASAGDIIKTADGTYYPVRDGVVVAAGRHAEEIMRRYPVPRFPVAEPKVITDAILLYARLDLDPEHDGDVPD